MELLINKLNLWRSLCPQVGSWKRRARREGILPTRLRELFLRSRFWLFITITKAEILFYIGCSMWAWVCFSWSLMNPEILLQSLISGAENLTHCKYSRPNSVFGWAWCLNPVGKKSINSCTQKTKSKARVVWAGVKKRKGTLKIGFSDFSTAGRLMQLDFFPLGLNLCWGKQVQPGGYA